MFLPFAVTVVLGYAFDRYISQITTFPIYGKDDVEKNIQITPNPSIEWKFIVPNSSAEVNEFFNLDPEFSLLSKREKLTIPAYSYYLRSLIDRDAEVDILFLVRVNVEKRTFSSDTEISPEWQRYDQEYVGTHFIKGLQYGGVYVGYYKGLVTKPEDIQMVKAAVANYIGKTGSISEILPENVDKLEEEIGDKVSQTVGHYAAGLTSFYPVFTLRKLVEIALAYPSLLKKEGQNVPVGMELQDLSTINENYTAFTKNSDLDPLLLELDEKYDDVRVAYNRFLDFEGRSISCSNELETIINEYDKRLTKAYNALSKSVADMDITGSTNQFDHVFDLYGKGAASDKYRRELDEIIKNWNETCKKNLKPFMKFSKGSRSA